MNTPLTKGTHHIGLTVSKLEESAAFFISLLGWTEVNRNNDYPAIFVSDGSVMVTLWKNKEVPVIPFDKNRNVGLHHVAFAVESESALTRVYDTLDENNVEIEFSPELVGEGPAKHMICYDPSGVRVEFIWSGIN